MVAKRQKDLDGDLFPRGAGPNSTPRVRKRDGQTLFGPQLKRTRLTRDPDHEKPPVAPVTQDGAMLSMSRLSVGMTVLALIIKADRRGVDLMLPGGLRASVDDDELLVQTEERASRIALRTSTESASDSDSDSSNDDDNDDADDGKPLPLWQVVDIGSVVRVAVVDIEKKKDGRKFVRVSLKPDLINVGMNPDILLVKGTPIYGAVKSVEDHGYVVCFGNNIPHTGFLPFDECPEQDDSRDTSTLKPGSPVETVTAEKTKVPEKRRGNFSAAVRLIAKREKVLKAVVDSGGGRTYEELCAGMAVNAKVVQQGPGGILLSFRGVFEIGVDASHIPRSENGSWDVKVGEHVLTRLISVDPARKRICASLLPCVVNHMTPRLIPSKWKTGTLLQTLKVERVKPGFGLILKFVDADETGDQHMKDEVAADAREEADGDTNAKDDLLKYETPIFAHISRVSDLKGVSLESTYCEGAVLTKGARVISVFSFDGIVNVDLRPSVLARKALSVEEIEAGLVYECRIVSHTTTGSLSVAVDGDPHIVGIVPQNHVSDVPIPSERLAKHPSLRIGSTIRCRVLSVNILKRKVYLTSRKSLVAPKFPVLSSTEQAAKALKANRSRDNSEREDSAVFSGTVHKITAKCSLIVSFCNNMFGQVPATELCLDSSQGRSPVAVAEVYPVGETVHVRVIHADLKRQRIVLSMRLKTEGKLTSGTPFRLGAIVLGFITGVDTESKHFVISVSQAALSSEAAPQGGKQKNADDENYPSDPIDCHLPFGHLSDISGFSDRMETELIKLLEGEGSSKQLESPISDLMLLAVREKTPVLTLKQSLVEAMKIRRLPSSFDEVEILHSKVGDDEPCALRGYVKALLPGGVIVGFLGDAVGFVRKSRIADHFVSDAARSLKMDQSVPVIVESIDVPKKRFSLSMRNSDVGAKGLMEDTSRLFNSLEMWRRVLRKKEPCHEFRIGKTMEVSEGTSRPYGMVYDLKSKESTAVGVVLDVSQANPDLVMGGDDSVVPVLDGTEKRRGDSASETPNEADEKFVRVIDVDPFTGVVDLSSDEEVVSSGHKKSKLSPGSTHKAKVLLVKSSYVILAVQKSKTRTVIAFGIGPVIHDNLVVRPGTTLDCEVLGSSSADKTRALVIIDWGSFRGQAKARSEKRMASEKGYAGSIALLRETAGQDESAVAGMEITGKVTKKFALHANVGVARGIVGQLHVTNVSSLSAKERASLHLGPAPPGVAQRFLLPAEGTRLNPAFIWGIRRAVVAGDNEPVVVDIALTKQNLTDVTVGARFLGFVKNLSSRQLSVPRKDDGGHDFARTVIAISPKTVVSCADVDCLFEDDLKLKPGSAVMCEITSVPEEGGSRIMAAISDNGKKQDCFFLGLVECVRPGVEIRVSIPWYARCENSKTDIWGTVDVCDVSDNYEETVAKMSQLKPGDVVRVRKITSAEQRPDPLGAKVSLTMRNECDSDTSDKLITCEEVASLKEGTVVRGFVRAVNKKGCFVAIGRGIAAQVKLCDLADDFVGNPEEAFPVGKLVVGTIGKIRRDGKKRRISLILRKRPRRKLNEAMAISELREGSKVLGTVRRVEVYGAILELSKGVSALLHKSEVDQDRFIQDTQTEWLVGQKLHAVVIKAKEDNLKLGTKRCYFEAAGLEEHVVDELLAENEKSKEAIGITKADALDFEPEQFQEREEPKKFDADVEQDGSDVEMKEAYESDSENEEKDDEGALLDQVDTGGVPALNISEKIDFTTGVVEEQREAADDSEADDDSAAEVADTVEKSSHDKREKKKLRLAAEKEIQRREESLAKNADAPESAEDFERLLVGEPNSSTLWIRYMAFCVGLSQIDKARTIAERAIDTISLQAEADRTNLWCAYINLEAQYGAMNAVESEATDKSTVKRDAAVFRVFERACGRITDVMTFHLRVASALRGSHPELADEIHRRASRQFKGSKKVWIASGQAKFMSGKLDDGRKCLERALQSLENRKHVDVISKFAQFEYKYGSVERGRTVFESLVGNFPKRVDIWNIYLDMQTGLCKTTARDAGADAVTQTRHLFQKFTSTELSSKKMKFAFKKWLGFEKKFGSKEHQVNVKNRARQYVEKQTTNV